MSDSDPVTNIECKNRMEALCNKYVIIEVKQGVTEQRMKVMEEDISVLKRDLDASKQNIATVVAIQKDATELLKVSNQFLRDVLFTMIKNQQKLLLRLAIVVGAIAGLWVFAETGVIPGLKLCVLPGLVS